MAGSLKESNALHRLVSHYLTVFARDEPAINGRLAARGEAPIAAPESACQQRTYDGVIRHGQESREDLIAEAELPLVPVIDARTHRSSTSSKREARRGGSGGAHHQAHIVDQGRARRERPVRPGSASRAGARGWRAERTAARAAVD